MADPRLAGLAKRFGNPPGSGAHSNLAPTSPTSTTSNTATSTNSGTLSPTANYAGTNTKGAVQYYYIFIIVIFAVFVGSLWCVAIARRRRRHLTANGRDNALSQDLGGYPNNRNWARRAFAGDVHAFQMRRDEGLNESGEAPPPYKPASQRQSMDENEYSPSGSIAIPMQTYPRDGHQKPPDYQWPQTVGESSGGGTPESSSARPEARSAATSAEAQESDRRVASSETNSAGQSPQSSNLQNTEPNAVPAVERRNEESSP